MFRKKPSNNQEKQTRVERVTSVLGSGIIWKGKISGQGGIRIEGTFEGEIAIEGMVVIGETGKVTCDNVCANTVIVAGGLNGGITAKKLEIRKTGRVWGDVTVAAFSTEEGGFLRGQITMQEEVDFGIHKPSVQDTQIDSGEKPAGSTS